MEWFDIESEQTKNRMNNESMPLHGEWFDLHDY